jgi:hypothetical protein
MFMHSCRCILFMVVTAFYPFAKWLENPFENVFGKVKSEKEKGKFPFLLTPSFWPERPSRPAAVPAEPARARPSFYPSTPSWAGPNQPARRRCRPSFLSAMDGSGPHVSATFFPQPSPPLARSVKPQPSSVPTPTFSARGGSVRAWTPFRRE